MTDPNAIDAVDKAIADVFRLTLTDPTPGMLGAYPSQAGRFLKVTAEDIRRELAGLDLVCWCKPGDPCHADVLLEIANEEESR